jgi:DNA mismatch endonuclease (patch repair protein)
MQANRGRDTSPELAVRSRLHALGLRYRVATPLPIDRRRRADVYFSRVGLYVFIDGCYWHGCPDHYIEPKTNVDFWRAKIEGNRLRDVDTTVRLQALGYEVLRFWEHSDPEQIAREIADRYISARSQLLQPVDTSRDLGYTNGALEGKRVRQTKQSGPM